MVEHDVKDEILKEHESRRTYDTATTSDAAVIA